MERCFFCQAGVQGFTLASCAAKSCSQNLKKLGDFPETLTPTSKESLRIIMGQP